MINKRIKLLRDHFDFTQEEFAEALGLSRRNVQRWEYAESDIAEHYLRLIQYTFNVNPEWLREGKGEMLNPSLPEELKLVVEWMTALPEKEANWLRVDMEMKYDIFKKWLELNSKES